MSETKIIEVDNSLKERKPRVRDNRKEYFKNYYLNNKAAYYTEERRLARKEYSRRYRAVVKAAKLLEKEQRIAQNAAIGAENLSETA
jgi:hypothetical protein